MPKGGVDSAFRLIAEVLQSQAIFGIGSLAQLVQSICLTSRGSGVRIPQLPQTFTIRQTTDIYQSFFCCVCCSCASTRHRTLNKSNAQMRVSNRGKLQHCSLCAGVARIKIFIFNGILARASPFKSLNSHKRSEAKRCRKFDTFCFWILWRKLCLQT